MGYKWIVFFSLVAAALVTGLVFTHKYAFRRGIEAEKTRKDGPAISALGRASAEALGREVHLLRVAKLHPEAFSSQDLKNWRLLVPFHVADVEKFAIPQAEKDGDEREVSRLRELVEEVHRLEAPRP